MPPPTTNQEDSLVASPYIQSIAKLIREQLLATKSGSDAVVAAGDRFTVSNLVLGVACSSQPGVVVTHTVNGMPTLSRPISVLSKVESGASRIVVSDAGQRVVRLVAQEKLKIELGTGTTADSYDVLCAVTFVEPAEVLRDSPGWYLVLDIQCDIARGFNDPATYEVPISELPGVMAKGPYQGTPGGKARFGAHGRFTLGIQRPVSASGRAAAARSAKSANAAKASGKLSAAGKVQSRLKAVRMRGASTLMEQL